MGCIFVEDISLVTISCTLIVTAMESGDSHLYPTLFKFRFVISFLLKKKKVCVFVLALTLHSL